MLQLRKSPTAYTLSLSVLIHAGLLMLIGSTVIISTINLPQHPTAVIDPHPPVDLPTVDDPETEPLDPIGQDPLANPMELPTEPSPQEPATSVPVITQPDQGTTFILPGMPGLSGPVGTFQPGTPGRPNGSPTTEQPRKIKFWDNEVANVSKLGVILDVSGSAHSFLAAAIREVEKNFETSPTLLVMGCGMSPTVKASDVRVENFGRSKPDKVKDRPGSRTSLGQLAQAEERIKGLDRTLDQFRKREDVWQIAGGDVGATRFAFDKLIEEGVDTIYWFADFQDKVDPGQMEGLIRALKKKGVRVIAHNFSGKPVPVEATRMAKESGGQTIALVPK